MFVERNEAITTFLRHSKTFKTMQKDAISSDPRNQQLIQSLNAAPTFSDMISLIDSFDLTLNKKKDSPANQLAFNAVVFFVGFVSKDANFIYHVSILKKEIIDYAIGNGYEVANPQNAALAKMG